MALFLFKWVKKTSRNEQKNKDSQVFFYSAKKYYIFRLERRAGKMRNNHVSLGEAISEWIKEKRLEEPIVEAKIVSSWTSIMGELIARNTQTIVFKNGKLYLTVTHPALKQELFYARDTIRTNLNQEIKSEAIKEVVIY